MDPMVALAAALAGYLIGSISFARLVGRLFMPGVDIAHVELSVPGTEGEKFTMSSYSATNLSLKKGPKAGCTTSLLDMLKVALPTYLFKTWYPDAPYFLIAATTAVAGHNWPIYYGFKGGRGYSAIYGALLVIDWLAIPVTAVLGMIFGMAVLRDVLMSYIAGLWVLIPWMWFRTHDLRYVAYAVAVTAMFMLATRPDIEQYLKFKREGKVNLEAAMQVVDMGRGLQTVAEKLGRRKAPGGQ